MGTFYMVYVEGEIVRAHKYESREQAEAEAARLRDTLKKDAYILESVVSVLYDITKRVDSHKSACEYLDIEDDCNKWPPIRYSAIAHPMCMLMTIARAWNEFDGFIPDFSSAKQKKYFPAFKASSETGRLVCIDSSWEVLNMYVANPRLCFKTEERAKQFGEQFINLWNRFLLIK
jgi:hypothetical protein